MHNALAVLFSLILSLATASALYLPQYNLSPASSPSSSLKFANTANKCTFTLWHKQLCAASEKINYIQLNEIVDHPNKITVDVASYRPLTARNSYSKISEKQVFAVEGLLDNKNLTIRGRDGSDRVTFEYDGLKGSSEMGGVEGDAYCVTGKWDWDGWQCGKGTRERKLECAFTCEKIEDEDDKEDSWSSELR